VVCDREIADVWARKGAEWSQDEDMASIAEEDKHNATDRDKQSMCALQPSADDSARVLRVGWLVG
jgi:hypothetical protein